MPTDIRSNYNSNVSTIHCSILFYENGIGLFKSETLHIETGPRLLDTAKVFGCFGLFLLLASSEVSAEL